MKKLEALQDFAGRHGLRYESREPADGFSDTYVYSPDLPDPRYRYVFTRCWAAVGKLDLWIGVNPGKGDTEDRRRPTLDRCILWSQRPGAAGLMIANLFAARYNSPQPLRDDRDAVGPHNDEALSAMSAIADRTIVAWGNWGRLQGRGAIVLERLDRPLCLGMTAAHQPRHPLYVPADRPLHRWEGRRRTRA